MKAMGIDVGTTTICGIVMDTADGKGVAVETLDNDAWLEGERFERIQSPERIWELVNRIYSDFVSKYDDIAVVGLTGQMHGIVYVDEQGEAVSPLYTWQDGRGNLEISQTTQLSGNESVCLDRVGSEAVCPGVSGKDEAGSATYASRLSRLTGYPMATGFGLTTHYYNLFHGLVPESASRICTIHDYVGMKLAGRKTPLLTSSDGASLGCYDTKNLRFDTEALAKAGISPEILPECDSGFAVLGKTQEGICVSGAIGDNQASVIGSVSEMEGSLLVNIGTSSQVSIGVKGYREASGVELRPVAGEDYIFVGAGLCGGRAYAVLEQFFAGVVEAMTGQKPGSLYDKMGELLEKRGLTPGSLTVDTRFCGTREYPEKTGGVYNLGVDNFTAEEFTFGILGGMAEELVTFYRKMQEYGAGAPKHLIGSGNAIRRNPYLRKIFENIFGMEMRTPVHKEEAAYGSTLFGLVAAGIYPSLDEAQKLISYL